ncbi:amidase [Marinicauda algicola]|uniref:Amidase n=1 Tax=Marinicauda algicola TaxID=2029849 RepID=A0A4S2H2B2_9PROT|nr:amidase [Marinicauda algicola]TGY89727.1 amidase [Marinicauda algicola]
MSEHEPTKPGSGATRRGLLGLMAGGAAGIAVAGRAGAQERVTLENLQCAEPVLGVSYTPAEREMMIEGLDAWVARAERLRAMEQPNELSPALVFDPRLPGRSYRAQTGGVRNAPREAGPRPSDPADIAFAPVWKQAAWMESGALTSAELTEIYLSRIAAHAGTLECFVTVTADLAREQAAAMDRERAAGRVRGPLHGVPYGLKDIIDVAGYPSTWGASVYRDRVAETTATVAWRLQEAGAVLLGKTTSGAIAYGDIWYDGITRNPFNPEEGSSGSSAGSASATAAGLVSFAIGTETLGSIVSPSHRCGATGLRPSFGRVPRTGAMALCWSLDKIGPLVRSVPDAAFVLAAINGADDADPSAFTHGFEADFSRDLAGMRVGYDPAWFEQGEEPDRAALEAARSLGVELVEIGIPEKPYDTLLTTLEAEAAAAFEELTLQNLDDRLTWQEPQAWPNTWRRARFASAVDLVNVDRFRREVMVQMDEMFAGLDAVIGPNFSDAMLLITNYTGQPQLAFRSGFVERPTRTIFGAPADESGQMFTVPMATSLWAPLFEEGNILALGRALEDRLGVAERRPALFA